MSEINRQWIFTARPKGFVDSNTFSYQESPLPTPNLSAGEVLVKTLYLSFDPAMRGWMDDKPSYLPPVELGTPMRASGIGQVVASEREDLPVGALVMGFLNWQDYAVFDSNSAGSLNALPAGTPPDMALSAFGGTSMTAYFGLFDVGQPKAGETVLVSAAAGAVGSIVGQIAKIKGCHVVGIAGTDEKCQWIVDELGFDSAINYKKENVLKALGQHCPRGIDVYFDNVGGDILQAALFRMNQGGRMVCCGVVSQYDTATPAPGPHGLPGLLVVRRLRMEGFIVMDYDNRREQADAELAGWVADGSLKYKVDIIEGLEHAPKALIGLLHGENTGKRMIRVSGDARA